jgi:galactonate dehydratase
MAIPLLSRRLRLQAFGAIQTAGAANDPLAVRDLRAWPLREPGSGRRYTVLRVDTAGGVSGWGECGEFTRTEFETAKTLATGLPATAYEIAWRKLGPAPRVRAAINMAMLDIAGKAAKAPAYQVLGGPTRSKVRAMAPLEGAAALDRAQAAGFHAFAVPTPATAWRNQGKEYMNKISALMAMMRTAAAPGSEFVLDGKGSLTPGDAQSIATELEKFHLLWFDEPCPPLNFGAVKKIAGENVTPIGIGRFLTGPSGFQNLLAEDAVDILRPDIAVHGISQIRRIAVIGEVNYVAVAPYHNGGPVATAAALQTAASLPNFFIQQIPLPEASGDREMRRAIAGDVEAVSGGFAALPGGHGLGVTVNERALDRYREAA